MRELWIKIINEANGDPGNKAPFGKFVCDSHFEEQYLQKRNQRYFLDKNAVPTLFWVDCIEMDDEMAMQCDKCKESEEELTNLKEQKRELLSQFHIAKSEFRMKIEKYQNEKNGLAQIIGKLRTEIDDLKKHQQFIEDELRTLKDSQRDPCTVRVNFFLILSKIKYFHDPMLLSRTQKLK